MLTIQAQNEIAAMTADLVNASCRTDLDQLHFAWLGCDADAADSDEEVRDVLADYIKEFRFSCAAGQA